MAQRWIFTRRDPRTTPPSVELRSDNTNVYRVDDDRAWRTPGVALRGEGGAPVGASHGLSVVRPRTPGPQIKPLGVIVTSDDKAVYDAALTDLVRALGNVTQGRGIVDLTYHRYDGLVVSGEARLTDLQPEVLTRYPTDVACARFASRVALDVELPDGVLFTAEETVTLSRLDAGADSATVVNGGDAEDVWAIFDIAATDSTDVEKVEVVNLDWPGASPRANPMGWTLYSDPDAAAADDGTGSSEGIGTVTYPLQGFTVDSGARAVYDAVGNRRDGLLVRRDWHPHLLPLHPGTAGNDVEARFGVGGGQVTMRRKDPYS